MKKNHIGMCGLDCSACAAFIATLNDDDELREETAKQWTERYQKTGRNRPSIKLEDINCQGCLSQGPVYLYCHQCEIRKCGLEKEIKSCKECGEYRCERLIELQKHLY